MHDPNGDVRLEAAQFIQSFAPRATIATLKDLIAHPVRGKQGNRPIAFDQATSRATYLLELAYHPRVEGKALPPTPTPTPAKLHPLDSELPRLTPSGFNRLAGQQGLAPFGPPLWRVARPRIELIQIPPTKATQSLGASHVGGLPDLPVGVPWTMRRGRHLSLLAQLDLSESRRADWQRDLPPKGHLYFYYDVDRGASDVSRPKDGGAVVFDPGGVRLVRRQRPSDLVPPLVFKPQAIGFRTSYELPPDAPGQLDTGLDDRRYADLSTALAAQQAPHNGWPGNLGHHLLGWSHPIQDPMEPELTSKLGLANWRILAEFTSDEEEFGIPWGDSGTVYFWIPQDDLKARRFDRVVVLEQCG